MVKKIKIFDNLSFIDLLKNLNNEVSIFYINKTFFLRLVLSFFNSKKIKKLKWNYIKYNSENNEIVSSIRENHHVANFVCEFLEELEKNKRIESSFYHYLVKHLSNNTNLIGFMSIEHFLIFINFCNLIFKNSKITYHIEKSEFDKIIKNKFEDEKNSFKFYSNPFRFILIKKIRYLIKNFYYVFCKKDYKFVNNKSICVLDSFDMNKPENFFCNKEFYDKIIFITNENKKVFKSSLNVNHFITFKIFYYLIINFFKYKNLFISFKFINFLFIKYNIEKKIFYNFFKKNNIKIFMTNHLSQEYSASAVAAINELDGEAIGYTMSFSESYSSYLSIDTFNYFFSFNNSQYYKTKYSNLKNIVSLGYISDYKFLNYKNDANKIRQQLLATGAKYIIGFFDQGSSEDNMFYEGHDVSNVGYKFLLDKIIEDNNFALIIKPKKPKLLKKKLGDNYKLLIEAKNTGRCIAYDNYAQHHVKNFEDTPAKIAMASDLTIHDTLFAGTAGLESALIGTKSILFDYYHLKKSQFDNNSLQIVYRNWDILWKDIKDDSNEKNLNLGNWEKIINKFDNYRDGKTNIRIMNFVEDLINSKKSNLN
jgi:hypothetical protein